MGGSTAIGNVGAGLFEAAETLIDGSPQLVAAAPFDGGSPGGLATLRETASEGFETGLADTVSTVVSSSSSSVISRR
jgi:hypothetical protein